METPVGERWKKGEYESFLVKIEYIDNFGILKNMRDFFW